jgi:hypothetical protein
METKRTFGFSTEVNNFFADKYSDGIIFSHQHIVFYFWQAENKKLSENAGKLRY